MAQYNGAYREGEWPPADALEPAPAPASAESTRSTADGPLTTASSSAAISAAAAKLGPLRSTGSFWASQPAATQVRLRHCEHHRTGRWTFHHGLLLSWFRMKEGAVRERLDCIFWPKVLICIIPIADVGRGAQLWGERLCCGELLSGHPGPDGLWL